MFVVCNDITIVLHWSPESCVWYGQLTVANSYISASGSSGDKIELLTYLIKQYEQELNNINEKS
jgi:hypothetical protein